MLSEEFNGSNDAINKIKELEPWNQIVELYETNEDPISRDIFRKMLFALNYEDASLRNLFDSAEGNIYKNVSHGLAYWLYETTLVYILFKSVIPLGKATWEGEYPKRNEMPEERECIGNTNNNRRLDLKLETKGKTFSFEVKWWPSNQERIITALQNDINRLQGIQGDRYLLTLWYSWEGSKEMDLKDITEFISKDRSLSYYGSFPAHVYYGNNVKDNAYFAFAGWKVNHLG